MTLSRDGEHNTTDHEAFSYGNVCAINLRHMHKNENVCRGVFILTKQVCFGKFFVLMSHDDLVMDFYGFKF